VLTNTEILLLMQLRSRVRAHARDDANLTLDAVTAEFERRIELNRIEATPSCSPAPNAPALLK